MLKGHEVCNNELNEEMVVTGMGTKLEICEEFCEPELSPGSLNLRIV